MKIVIMGQAVKKEYAEKSKKYDVDFSNLLALSCYAVSFCCDWEVI